MTSSLPAGYRSPPTTFVVFIHSMAAGGAERVISRLLSQWDREGKRLHLVLTRSQIEYPIPEDVTVHIVGKKEKSLVRKVLNKFVVIAQARRILQEVRPDAVLAFMPLPSLLAVLSRALSGVRTRVVVSERNSWLNKTHGVRGQVVKLVTRLAYPRADRVVAVSQALAKELVARGVPCEKVCAIENGVDLAQLRAQAQAPDLLVPTLFADSTVPTVVYAGRLEPVKGVDRLLDAWSRVLARGVTGRLLIVGKGSQREALERQARALPDGGASVVFAGHQANPFGLIARSDVFVLASRSEGFPNALLEAMALSRACVAFDCQTGPRELLGDNDEHGLLVPDGDIEGLANAMCRLLTEPELRARLGHAALERASVQDVRQVAARFEAVLLGHDIRPSQAARA